jgi:hypothetical protein
MPGLPRLVASGKSLVLMIAIGTSWRIAAQRSVSPNSSSPRTRTGYVVQTVPAGR